MKFILRKRHSQYLVIMTMNGLLILVMVACNIYFQSFCVPSPWTMVFLFICFVNTIVFSKLEVTRLAPLTSFINGISFFVFLYCILFLEEMNFIGLVLSLFGFGLVFFIPHFFIIQLIWCTFIMPAAKGGRYYFISAVLLCSLVVTFTGLAYKNALISIERFKRNNYTALEKNFMTEKILGMHFIYHTRIEMIYDGWRPPIHEPFLVVGMWLNHRKDPLNVDLETRLRLYKSFFPENKFKFECSCAIQYSRSYHKDPLWSR